MAAVALAQDVSLVPRRVRCFPLVAALVVTAGLAGGANAASTLVLSKNRVEVSITWRSQYSGETGSGIAIPISDQFGFFAFTDPKNPEVFVKVLDFGSSSPLLLFYGGLTDFEYHLTFHNRCTGQDVKLDKAAGSYDGGADNRSMLAGCENGPALAPPAMREGGEASDPGGAELPREYAAVRKKLALQPLATSPNLFLSKERIQVSLTWKSQYDGSTGVSIATPINENFGFLSFFNAENPEVFVKVLDFGSSSPLLLFYGGLTDFEYDVTFTNLCTNQTASFHKPPGSYAGGADNRAMMAVCATAPLPPHIAAVKATEKRFQELYASGATPLETIRAIGTFMAANSEYVSTHVDEEGLWVGGLLKNGRVHIVSHNFDFDVPPVAAAPPSDRIDPLTGGLIPRSGYARLLHAFEGDADADKVVSDLSGILQAGGYQVRANTDDASLPVLRDINGDGFFWLNTHGGGAYWQHGQNAVGYYAMYSNTLVTAHSDEEALIADDLANDRLVYYTCYGPQPRVNGRVQLNAGTCYGINWKFVEHYWHFSPNAILNFTVCVLMQDVSGPREFVQAMLGNQAGVVFGWTGKSSAGSGYKSPRYFVDRLLGANSTIGGITKESPEQRPFPWKLVYEEMLKHSDLVQHETEPSKLVYRANGNEAVLDPAIQDLLVNEYDEKLYLRGDFGQYPGRVTIGSQMNRTDCTWKPEQIECSLPSTGPGSNGNVYVEVEGRPGVWRRSNTRQLLEWDLPIQYQWTDVYDVPGLKFTSNGKLRFRADVGYYRKKPGADPFKPLVGIRPTKDSFIQITGSGTHNDGECTTTLSGNATFQVPTVGPGLPYILAAPVLVETGSHDGALGFSFGYVASPFMLTIVCPKSTQTVPAPLTVGELDGPVTFPSPDPNRPPEGPFFAMTVHFNSDFRLTVQETQRTVTAAGGVLLLGGKADAIPTPAFDPNLEK